MKDERFEKAEVLAVAGYLLSCGKDEAIPATVAIELYFDFQRFDPIEKEYIRLILDNLT